MRRVITIVAALLAGVCPFAAAQQAGENINVLPVVLPDQAPDDWFLIGDGYLQRQVEPTIAASTRNPDHLLAFFVDYRAVDIQDDVGLGQSEAMMAAYNTTRTFMMAASGLCLPTLPHLRLAPVAAAEAWVGMSRSYDGGLTWSGGFLPGAPFDTGDGGNLVTPIDGLQAATDPVLAPGPCGKFYLVFMAFTRGGESKLVVARYVDNNYAGGGDHITYEGMTVIESGNNATHGYFLDKPDIEVDVFREPNADICADRVYVSYSTFNGLDKDGKFQSKVSFARSIDGGLTFETQKLNPPYNQNQGSALAVDPADGTVYMFWRHFWAPDAILMVRSTDYGKKWSKPVNLTETVPMVAFDQPSISVNDALPDPPATQYTSPVNPGFPEVAFRSNGFPTAAVTDEGTVFVAWQERVDVDDGRPSAAGTPRIVVVRSEDDGAHWTDINGAADRLAVDMGWRDLPGDPNVPAPGFGALPQTRLAGPQVQPRLAFAGGQLLLAYYESRGRIANYGYQDPLLDEFIVNLDLGPDTGFITGYDRLIDFRAALLDPTTGALETPSSTIQVSRYPIRGDADLALNSEDLMDVAPVNPDCYPDSGNLADPICVRQVNRFNAVQSASGTTPFMGDYSDVAPVVQFVFDGQRWKWATEPTDVPYQGFHTIFTDNRHLIPATENEDGLPSSDPEWQLSHNYDPPFADFACSPDPGVPECINKPGCINAGSRNTDVLTSRIDTSLVLSAPTTFKELDEKRGFPFTVKNRTGDSRAYRFRIIEGADNSSFHRFIESVDDSEAYGNVEIFAYSSGSFMVYVNTLYAEPVRVEVSEVCPAPNGFEYFCTGSSGILTFNLNAGYDQVPAVTGPDTQLPETVGDPFFVVSGGDPDNPFVINPFVINPFVINPFVINPFVINPFVINPFVINPFVINPFVINASLEGDEIEQVIDTTWTVSPGESNTASSYLPLVNIDNAQAFIDNGYIFQLIIYKGSLYGGLSGCESTNVGQPQILANVVQDPSDTTYNPFVINPFVINPFVINPFVINPFVINSSFTMAPADDPNQLDDQTTRAEPAADEVKITLRAFKTASTALKQTGGLEFKPWEDPPSLVIVPQPCDDDDPDSVCNILSLSPDLIPYVPVLDEDSLYYIEGYEVVAAAGGTLVAFPNGGWTLANEGLTGQTYGDAVAENGFLNHGFHICEVDWVDDPIDRDWSKEPLDLSGCIATIQEALPHALPDVTCDPPTPTNPNPQNPDVCSNLALWDSDDFPAIDLTIPVLEPGGYYLVLYVDDTLEVSERNEVNNWVAVPLTIINPPPVADDLSLETDEDTPVSGKLTATDANGDPFTFAIVTAPSNGALDPLDLNSGDFTYTPNPNFNGTDSFTFVANDGLNDSNVATVTITVEAVNDPPTASDATFETEQNTPVSGTLSGSDIDAGDVLTFTITAGPTFGTVVVDDATTGAFTYSPNAGFAGQDTFTYEVADIAGATATGTITVNVIDTTPDWLFIGYDNPWTPGYTVTAGSSIPLKWRYADPVTGALVNSSAGGTEVRITGWPETGCYSNGSTIYVVEDSGSSDLRYVNGSWQINWDTVGLPVGCYEVAVYHPTTHQLDTHNSLGQPLTVVLR